MRKEVDVVFLFASKGAAAPGQIKEWNPDHKCASHYTEHHSTEGYIQVLGELWKRRSIDHLKIFYESNVGHGTAEFYPGVYGEVVPHIDFIDRYIDDNTIIFARGGFKGWHDFLKSRKGKNWLLLYPANTGRERWPWWDIILHDLSEINEIDSTERYWHYFYKPVYQQLFHRTEFRNRYDVCIGANHIHDRKGQWRTVRALAIYKDMFGKNLRAVLPGSFRRGEETNKILDIISDHKLDVTLTGMVPREDMAKIYNSSKIFCHLTSHGQNDRGPLEAMSCGCKIVILDPSRHSPVVWKDKSVCCIPKSSQSLDVADLLREMITSWNFLQRKNIEFYFKSESDFDDVILPRMEDLFSIMASNPPNIESKRKLYEYFTPGFGNYNC